MPMGLTPSCSKKSRSSMAMTAWTTMSGTSSSGTLVRLLVGLHPGHGVAGAALAGRHVGRADVGRLLEVVELGQLGLGEDDPHAGDAGQHGQPDQEQRAA